MLGAFANSKVIEPQAARPMLGAAACGFFGVHAACQIHAGRPENLWWACHVAALLVGLGLLLGRRRVAAVGVLLLAVGIPLWLINLCYGGVFYPTSLLTHLGGFSVGLYGLRRTQFVSNDWQWALAVVGGLLLASRAFTSPEQNINLAFAAWGSTYSGPASPSGHVLSLMAVWGFALWAGQQVLQGVAHFPLNRRGKQPALFAAPCKPQHTDMPIA